MNSEEIDYCMMRFNTETINYFDGTDEDKNSLTSILYEWNTCVNVKGLCKQWVKVRPKPSIEHLHY